MPDGVVWVPANSFGRGVLADLASPGSSVTVKGAGDVNIVSQRWSLLAAETPRGDDLVGLRPGPVVADPDQGRR